MKLLQKIQQAQTKKELDLLAMQVILNNIDYFEVLNAFRGKMKELVLQSHD